VVQIIMNLALFFVWMALTAALTAGVSILGEENPSISGASGFAMWLAGQLVILSPLILVAWKRRRYDFE
jgi:hypothetical protein